MLIDSGGVQEETTVLGVPCPTLRDSTERPMTVTHGTNTVVGLDPAGSVVPTPASSLLDSRKAPGRELRRVRWQRAGGTGHQQAITLPMAVQNSGQRSGATRPVRRSRHSVGTS
ncbi:MAG TPA: UDP-N-acetylglucosamine 2-epimerase [Acidimicrobiales bacterium]|nr:UDP-N-acetylglucosamine 2-epimerase [Acidimicrobiales bacterium]